MARSPMVVFGLTFVVAVVGLWLYPTGHGQLAPSWNGFGLAAVLLAGLASGLATRRFVVAPLASGAMLAGLASAWAFTKLLDPSRPEGDLMVLYWTILALLVGLLHVVGVLLRSPAQWTESAR